MVRGGRLELPWCYPLAPQASASTNFAILASIAYIYFITLYSAFMLSLPCCTWDLIKKPVTIVITE